MSLEIVEKYSHMSVKSKDAEYPMFLLVTFRNVREHADKGPGRPSPYKYLCYYYGRVPAHGQKFWMSFFSDTRLKSLRKRGVKDISQEAYRFIIKQAFEPSEKPGDAKYNLKQMVEYYL